MKNKQQKKVTVKRKEWIVKNANRLSREKLSAPEKRLHTFILKKTEPERKRKEWIVKNANKLSRARLSQDEKKFHSSILRKAIKAEQNAEKIAGLNGKEIFEIKKIAVDAGVRNWERYYLQNETALNDFLNGRPNLIWATENNIAEKLAVMNETGGRKFYKQNPYGEIIRIGKNALIKEVLETIQFLRSNFSCTGVSVIIQDFRNGDIIVAFPDAETIEENEMENETVENITEFFASFSDDKGEQLFIAYFSKDEKPETKNKGAKKKQSGKKDTVQITVRKGGAAVATGKKIAPAKKVTGKKVAGKKARKSKAIKKKKAGVRKK